MGFRFSFLTGVSALLVAACAAYYSVFGLSHLFAGASVAVILMASCLEFSKIVAVSFLQRYWSRVGKGLRVYMTICVLVLVCITSAGIYGFLSNAYQQTSNKMVILDGKISILKNKADLFETKIKDNQNIIASKTKRIDLLNTIRLTQENRLTNADHNSSRRSVRNDISNASLEISKLTADIDTITSINNSLSDSVNKYKTEMITSQAGSEVASDIGPIKYIAELTGLPMDKVVNIFILLLIFVFDPLAVALVIATNKILQLDSNTNKFIQSSSEPLETEPLTPLVKDTVEEQIVNEPYNNTIEESPVETSASFEPEESVLSENESIPVVDDSTEDVSYEPITELVEKTDNSSDNSSPNEENINKIESIPYEPVIPNGKIDLDSIREKRINRGFSVLVPPPHAKHNNTIERLKS